MKVKRQAKILEIIRTQAVETQEELLSLLRQQGIHTTQATISRDIKELHLIKTLSPDGRYRYSVAKYDAEAVFAKFESLFQDAVEQVDYAGNIVVVRCLPGMAQAVCAAMDSQQMDIIVGTLAGEDTFICIVKEQEQAIKLVSDLRKLMR